MCYTCLNKYEIEIQSIKIDLDEKIKASSDCEGCSYFYSENKKVFVIGNMAVQMMKALKTELNTDKKRRLITTIENCFERILEVLHSILELPTCDENEYLLIANNLKSYSDYFSNLKKMFQTEF